MPRTRISRPIRIKTPDPVILSPVRAKQKADQSKAARKAKLDLSRGYKVGKEIRKDLGLESEEVKLSQPVLAAAVRPSPPAETLPPSWRKYFAQMARYAQAIQYRHRIATKHNLPVDWWDVPVKGGLNDVLNAIFIGVEEVSTILNITPLAAARLMHGGLIPSFRVKGELFLTTIHDLTIYLAMNRVIDWRVIMFQAGWREGLGGKWRDPKNGDYYPLKRSLAIVKARMEAKWGETQFGKPTAD